MFKASPDSIRRWLPRAGWLLLGLGLLALLLLAVAGPAYRLELLELGEAFGLFRYAAYIGIFTALMALAPLGLALYLGGARRAVVLSLVALLAGALSVAIPYGWRAQAQSVPPIHDITTDTDDPPAFRAIAPLREDAPNPVAYPGEETAEQQRQAYPDLETLMLAVDPETAMDASVTVAHAMGWELVAVDAAEGRLEGTATTRWFGFEDDVVIRIQATGEGSALDIRSKSRVGRSDVGTNAARIREFRERLLDLLGENG
ncbi:DUF1499 domain-containing protein [Gammaproteobacteria bacterium AB-CW1]|uniref:DUF1499 domain-containing protein n=1 Tax=Natronospira elongata TaxID=3110268 RepID=A0AAP6MKV1_9GAMM|nr:DUF1499 domain-containing protein [Gammaproteobacteria bacterium AB-CW1]